METFLKMRDLVLGMQKDVEATFSKQNKTAGKRVRKATSQLRELAKQLKAESFTATGEKADTATSEEAAPAAPAPQA